MASRVKKFRGYRRMLRKLIRVVEDYQPDWRPDEADGREEFLELFEEKREQSFVGLCVLGGIFSEGIDLLGEKLIGAILVGTGLPQLGNEREILRSFYTENGENLVLSFPLPQHPCFFTFCC